MFLSYAQNFEDVLLWRVLGGVDGGFYIDVGAWDPDRDSITRAFSDRGWRGVNVEPGEACFRRLAARRPRDVNLQVAVGAAPGAATFYEVAASGLSTLDRATADLHGASGFTVTERAVEVTTLAEVCRAHAPDTIHFLKIDCEGSERAVLEGADFARFRPWVVVVEATEPNSRRPTHQRWEDLLLAADYRFAWFDGLNRFYVEGARFDAFAPLLAMPPNVFDAYEVVRAPAEPPPRVALLPGPAVTLSDEDRIALAARCRDCDDIPKVADAGRVRTEADGTAVQVMHNGLKVLAGGYYGAWMTRLIALCSGHHEPQEEKVFARLAPLLPADARMVELGGFWAYYTAWFLSGSPGRRAVVLEPDPEHLAVGRRNLALNGLGAEFVNACAGGSSSEAVPFAAESGGTYMLPCRSVADLLAEFSVERLDLLHCDIQGGELDVLASCRPLFAAGRIGWVFVSTHVHQISGDPVTHQKCLAVLREAGAVVEVEHTPYESFSGDGLIVARFGAPPPGWEPVAVSRARPGETLFRDPLFDLADLAERTRRSRDDEEVAAFYRFLLLREPEFPGATGMKAVLEQAGAAGVFDSVLLSPEFRANRDAFAARYFPAERPASDEAGPPS